MNPFFTNFPQAQSNVSGLHPGLGSWAQSLVRMLDSAVDVLVAVAFAAILLMFFWGFARYLWGGSEQMAKQGKNLMLWSIAAMFVAITIWGIISLIAALFGVSAADPNQFTQQVKLKVVK